MHLCVQELIEKPKTVTGRHEINLPLVASSLDQEKKSYPTNPAIEHHNKIIQEGHDGPVSLHWLIHKIPSYRTI